MTLQEAINDLKTATDEAYGMFGQAGGDVVVQEAVADGIAFIAAKIRQLSVHDVVKHVCGLSGYNGMIDDPCPACGNNQSA